MFIFKIRSPRGQISMEIGILIIAVIIVSSIVAYYYITSYLNSSPNTPGVTANKTIEALNNVSKKYSNSIR